MHHCKPPLGNPTREEAIVRIAELEGELTVIKNYGGENDHGYQTRGNFDAKCRVCGDHERVCGTAYRSADRARRAAQRSADEISAKLSEVCEQLSLANSERLTDGARERFRHAVISRLTGYLGSSKSAELLTTSIVDYDLKEAIVREAVIRAARGAKEKG